MPANMVVLDPDATVLDMGKMAASRLWAVTRFPYFAAGLFALRPVAEPGIGTLAVDRVWRLYCDPAAIAAWSTPQLGSVLVHEVLHLLRDHAGRADSLGVDDRCAVAWNVACDAEINDDLFDAKLPLPGSPVVPASLGAKPGRLAEEYFAALRSSTSVAPVECGSGVPVSGQLADTGQEASRSTSGSVPSVDDASGVASLGQLVDSDNGARCSTLTSRPPVDCGSGAHGIRRPGEIEDAGADDEDTGGITAVEADLIRLTVARDVALAAQNRGTVPAGLVRWAEGVLRPRVDWRRELGQAIRRGAAQVSGRVDYSYRRRSRRSTAVPDVVLAGLVRPVPEVVVVCDTSGSMGTAELERCLAEIDGIVTDVGLRARRVAVLAVDAKVHATSRVRRASQVRLGGGGGTDMCAGIAAAAALKPRPHVVIVLTDGYTPWPAQPPPGVRVIVALIGGEAVAAPPGWARTIRVEYTR